MIILIRSYEYYKQEYVKRPITWNSAFCPHNNVTGRRDLLMTRLIFNDCAKSIEFDYAASFVRHDHGNIFNYNLVHHAMADNFTQELFFKHWKAKELSITHFLNPLDLHEKIVKTLNNGRDKAQTKRYK